MEDQQTLSIPPGVVPSESKEDLYRKLCYEENEGNTSLLKEDTKAVSMESLEEPVLLEEQTTRSDTPTSAWPEQKKDFNHSTENLTHTNNHDDTGGSYDLLKEVLMHQERPSSPKRPLSPLKKFNKVAPLNITEKNSVVDSQSSLDSPLLTAAKPIVMDTNATQEDDDNTAHIIANPNVDSNVTFQIKPFTDSSITDDPTYSSVVRVKPSHHQFDSSHIGAPTTSDHCTNEQDHEDHNEPVVYAKVNRHRTTEKTDAKKTEDDDTDGYMIPEEPEISMATHNAKTYNQKPPPQQNVQLISMKPVSEVEVVATYAQCFPAGSSYDMQPIHYMASTGDKKKLVQILAQLNSDDDDDQAGTRGSVDVTDSEGRTPLMHAIHNEHFACVKLLMDAGADVDIVSNDGSTPVHHICYTGSYEMLALLLSSGADGMIPDNNGRYPIHWVTNNSDTRCTQLLIDKVVGIDVNVRDSSMMTPLMWAAFHAKPEQVKVLKENGADPSLADVDGMCAIHWAIHRHETGTLKELIDMASTKYQDNRGRTVMHVAAEQGCAKQVNIIRSVRPTSVQDFDKQGRTPLHWAAVCDNPDVIKALLAAEANPNIKDVNNRTPMEYAVEKQLNYCALLLSKAQGGEVGGEVGTDQGHFSFTTSNEGQEPVAAAAIATSANLDRKSLQATRATLLKSLSAGCWMYKFTEDGKGPMHLRFFTVVIDKQKLCWAKSAEAADKDIKSDKLLNVRSSVSPLVQGRKDFDPIVKHRYAFTILTTHR